MAYTLAFVFGKCTHSSNVAFPCLHCSTPTTGPSPGLRVRLLACELSLCHAAWSWQGCSQLQALVGSGSANSYTQPGSPSV